MHRKPLAVPWLLEEDGVLLFDIGDEECAGRDSIHGKASGTEPFYAIVESDKNIGVASLGSVCQSRRGVEWNARSR